jgi:probable phosphoglycerate mutase
MVRQSRTRKASSRATLLVSLGARGRLQAARVAERLVSLRPQVLYSSDLQRAQETANIIGRHLGLTVRLCEGLREWNIGTWIGQSAAVYLAHLEAIGVHPVTYVPAGGESRTHKPASCPRCKHWPERMPDRPSCV